MRVFFVFWHCSFFRKLYVAIIIQAVFVACSPIGSSSENINIGELAVPGEFEVLVVVDSLKGRARHIAVNDNGDIYVKLRFPDSIGGNVALRDTNGDGTADIIIPFDDYEDKGSYGTAMRIYNGYIYFSSTLNVFRQKLTPGKLVPDSEIELVLKDDHPHGRHEHQAKPVTFDNDGHMYVPFGAPSNCCQIDNRTPGSPGMYPCPMLEDHGGIWQFDANKLNQTQKDGKLYATGLRSVVGLDWNPVTNGMYVVHHGRDDLLRLWPEKYSPWESALFPSEEFFSINEGDNGGWPYFFYDQEKGKRRINPEYLTYQEELGDGSQYKSPLIGFPGHWAPNDLLFYQGDQFPDRYKNGAFIAFHGATNRAPYPQAGYFICFVPFENGKPSGPWEVFADGFAGVDPIVNVSDAEYRPMGLAVGPDGSLYVADTEKGKIWRILYKGDKKKFGKKQLAKMEEHKAFSHIRTPDPVEDNLDKGKKVKGEEVYKLYCGTCHQNDGKGDASRFPPLNDSEWVTGDKSKLINVIMNGLQGPIEVKGKPYEGIMPQHSFLSDEDIAEVLTYIRQNFGNESSPISEAEVAKYRK
ncbi:PQQ-dependent sugar dehydrogenase [Olivibacter sitiensis]|uniref:PQQ-dependent sugar dehydrogenase n=1 Tax=Olivibacter sitiensis TaxID=376470 RepID=UPI000407B62F|nr:PQQ-dependent sugar dehydrogenase [Olivibacter sitiensis]